MVLKSLFALILRLTNKTVPSLPSNSAFTSNAVYHLH